MNCTRPEIRILYFGYCHPASSTEIKLKLETIRPLYGGGDIGGGGSGGGVGRATIVAVYCIARNFRCNLNLGKQAQKIFRCYFISGVREVI